MLMNKMLPDCTDMTKADNRIIDSITTNSSQYNMTFSEDHLEEISPQSKALCRRDWGLCHQQAKVQMSDNCTACNFSFHCFIKIAERRFLQMLINPCVQLGGYSSRLNRGERGKRDQACRVDSERRWFHWADQQSLFFAKVT